MSSRNSTVGSGDIVPGNFGGAVVDAEPSGIRRRIAVAASVAAVVALTVAAYKVGQSGGGIDTRLDDVASTPVPGLFGDTLDLSTNIEAPDVELPTVRIPDVELPDASEYTIKGSTRRNLERAQQQPKPTSLHDAWAELPPLNEQNGDTGFLANPGTFVLDVVDDLVEDHGGKMAATSLALVVFAGGAVINARPQDPLGK